MTSHKTPMIDMDFQEISWDSDKKTDKLIKGLFLEYKTASVGKKKQKRKSTEEILSSSKKKKRLSDVSQTSKRDAQKHQKSLNLKETDDGKKAESRGKDKRKKKKKSRLEGKTDSLHREDDNVSSSPQKKRNKKMLKRSSTADGDSNVLSSSTVVQGEAEGTSEKKVSKKSQKNKYKHLAGIPRYPPEEDQQSTRIPIPSAITASYDDTVLESMQGESNTSKTKKKKHKVKDIVSEGSAPHELEKSVSNLANKKHKCDDKKIVSESTSQEAVKKGESAKKKKRKKAKKDIKNDPPMQKAQMPIARNKINISKLRAILSAQDGATKPMAIESTTDVGPKKSPSKPEMSLRDQMMDQLKAARFRHLNEQLYTTTGDEAYEMFQGDRDAFQVYHEGFRHQVVKWPENPLDRMAQVIKSRPKSHVVADFGCGDAKLAQMVPQKVHSFDLVALNKRVTACDMANVPLEDESVDTAVFCLSLMGTNLAEYVLEANRVLKDGGSLLVAEVVSRFEKNIGSFARKIQKMGFELIKKDTTNKMFVWFEFKKTGGVEESRLPNIELKPCVYKKR